MNGFDQMVYLAGIVALLAVIAASPSLYREAMSAWRWSKLRQWIQDRIS